jgi:hypothetical protein
MLQMTSDKVLSAILLVSLSFVSVHAQQSSADQVDHGHRDQGSASQSPTATGAAQGTNNSGDDSRSQSSGTARGPSGNVQTLTAADWGEDLNSLEVPGTPGTRVPVTDGFQIDEAVYPEFTRELLRIQWRPLDPLDLLVIKPTHVKKPPVILYLYSFPSDTDGYVNTEFCKSLTERGFAAVGFVSALTGPRFHDRPNREWFVSELQESLATSVHDVQFILDYLTARGDLDMSRVGMWGDGSGASIAIMAAAADPRIKVLDLLDPWGDWPAWLAQSSLVPEQERAQYLKPEFLKKVENLDPVKWLPALRTQEVRLQLINSVMVTPTAAKKAIETAAPPNTKIVHYESAKDFLKQVAPSDKGFDWIKAQLGSATDPASSFTALKGSPDSPETKR